MGSEVITLGSYIYIISVFCYVEDRHDLKTSCKMEDTVGLLVRSRRPV